ncbi:MAG: LapA family protein [Calditerrivibrio sp.]|nr:LapA family protein [Calditerrivibrio sp.]MCA1933194.1 LapA family protein [Calditerrivibrio sp.]MCA1980972.1 LapA family protein [Calditerrivibrio sp.]
MRVVYTIIKVVILLIVILFAALNIQSVEVRYFIGRDPIPMPLFVVIVLSFLLGMGVFWLLSIKRNLKKFIETNKLKSEINKLNDELKSIKSAPIGKVDKK